MDIADLQAAPVLDVSEFRSAAISQNIRQQPLSTLRMKASDRDTHFATHCDNAARSSALRDKPGDA
jgi:hypothetical protein